MDEPVELEVAQRIVRRALELDDDLAPCPASGFLIDPAALVAAAAEVGINAEAMHRAIAEERLAEPLAPGVMAPIVGRRAVVVDRTVACDVDTALARIDRWLVDGHHLRRERRPLHGARAAEWTRRSDLAATLQRGVRSLGGGASLGKIPSILAEAEMVDVDHTLVRLTARRAGRTAALAGIGSVSGASLAGGATMVTLAVPGAALVVVPGAAVAGAIAVAARRAAERIEADLARLLDQVDASEPPLPITAPLTRRLALRAHG